MEQIEQDTDGKIRPQSYAHSRLHSAGTGNQTQPMWVVNGLHMDTATIAG
jgi:hypothetical protein